MKRLDVEVVIVVVRFNGQFRWFKSDRELWVLDANKWTRDFLDAGFQVPERNPSERFAIPVVNEMTAAHFLAEMRVFEINKEDLARELLVRFLRAGSWWDVGDLFPIMLVDFDRKHVCAFYPAGTRMERYIPDSWTGEFEDFMTKYPEDKFPQYEKFWIQNGVNILDELNQRGQRLTRQG